MTRGNTAEAFIGKAIVIHDAYYDYSKVVYVNRYTPVIIICPVHGDFEQKPIYHILRKSGCPECYRDSKTYSENKFLELATKYPTGLYTYGEYFGFRRPLSVVCMKHNYIFTTTPANHLLQDGGCKFCRIEKISITDSEWLTRFNKAYPNQYDYSKIISKICSSKKICVVCPLPDHGEFFPLAGAHALGKHGCPTCAALRYMGGYTEEQFILHPETKQLSGKLYLIKIIPEDSRTFLKVGITVESIFDRFRYKMPYTYKIISVKEGMLYDLHTIERSILNTLKSYQYIPRIRFPGWTECLRLESYDSAIVHFL